MRIGDCDLSWNVSEAPIVELLLQCQELSAAAEESLSSQASGCFGIAAVLHLHVCMYVCMYVTHKS